MAGIEISGVGVELIDEPGSGTVTSVSVTTANGVSGSVATATTTPAITLTLGAITPTSVAVGGATIGANALAVTGAASIGGKLTIVSGNALQIGNAATTGLVAGVLAATTNASIVITDSTGQAYRIPCII